MSPFEELYTARGSQGIIIGSAFAEQLNLNISPGDSVFLVLYNGTYTRKYQFRVLTILKQSPAFKFSNLPSVLSQDLIISFPMFKKLAGQHKY